MALYISQKIAVSVFNSEELTIFNLGLLNSKFLGLEFFYPEDGGSPSQKTSIYTMTSFIVCSVHQIVIG
jgi:hypothetical protein